MTPMISVASSENRAEWLAARKGFVCGSEIAAAMGESPYQTRAELINIKAGLAPEFEGNEATEIGSELEPVVASLATKRYGWKLCRHGILITRQGWSIASTPDYVMATPYGPAVVQIKLTSSKPTDLIEPLKSGKPSSAAFAKGPPLYYQLQVQAELACTGYDHGVLLVLHLQPICLRSYYIPRHEGVITKMVDEAGRFMREVESLREAIGG